MPLSGTSSIRPAVPKNVSRTVRVYSVNVVAVAERRIVPSMSQSRMRRSAESFILLLRLHVGRSCAFNRLQIGIAQFSQFVPAFVLLGLRRIGIFFAFKPEAKPIHCPTLRSNPLSGILQNMYSMLDVWYHE